MRLTAHLITLSVLSFACASIPRPDTDMCVVNAPMKHQKCYNLNRDYDSSGNLNAGAVPTYKPAVVVEDLNKNITTDADGWAHLKAYIRELRRKAGESCGVALPEDFGEGVLESLSP